MLRQNSYNTKLNQFKVKNSVAFIMIITLCYHYSLHSLELTTPLSWLYPEEGRQHLLLHHLLSLFWTYSLPYFFSSSFSNCSISLYPPTFWDNRDKCIWLIYFQGVWEYWLTGKMLGPKSGNGKYTSCHGWKQSQHSVSCLTLPSFLVAPRATCIVKGVITIYGLLELHHPLLSHLPSLGSSWLWINLLLIKACIAK